MIFLKVIISNNKLKNKSNSNKKMSIENQGNLENQKLIKPF